MSQLSQCDKEQVAAIVRRGVDRIMDRMYSEAGALPGEIENHYGMCVYLSLLGVAALHKMGLGSAFVVGGTCHWPRLRPDQDDGKPTTCTHFGFKWEENSLADSLRKLQCEAGMLPEVHAWIVIPENQEIVDFSTGDFPALCRKMIGKDWPGDLPPKFFWTGIEEALKPETPYIYAPISDATKFVISSIAMMLTHNAIEHSEIESVRKEIEEAFGDKFKTNAESEDHTVHP